jgi:hypothetical protein
VWRTVSKPLIQQLQSKGDSSRPRLSPEQRSELREPFLGDIELLEQVTGASYADWLTHRDGATFSERRGVAEGSTDVAGVAG